MFLDDGPKAIHAIMVSLAAARVHERSMADGRDREYSLRLLACKRSAMPATLTHRGRAHGVIERYMGAIGLEPAQVSALRSALVEP